MTRLRLAIVQEYIPRYRSHFFSGLVDQLNNSNIETIVVCGTPTGAQAARGDAATRPCWQRYAEPRRINVRPLDAPFYGSGRHWRDCDGVIFTLRGNSFDLNAEIVRKSFSGRRIGTWGPIRTYVNDENALDMMVERYQMRFSDHVFAYTRSGAEFAIERGADPNAVTAVMNSTDTSETLTESATMACDIVQEFEQRHGLTRGKTFGYIGGLDMVKRIDVLVDALNIVWQCDPQIKLVIGGRGDQEYLLDSAVDRGQVVRLGYAGPKEKALINHVSEAVLNPGRIGLLAVECMAMGIPILTTDWRYHAPEYEYLIEGKDVFVSADTPRQFAELVLERTAQPSDRRRQQIKNYPTLANMINNFASGVLRMMS